MVKTVSYTIKNLLCKFKICISYVVYRIILYSINKKEIDKFDFDVAVVCMASLGDFITFCSVAKELSANGKSIVLVCRANTGIDEFAELTGYFKNVIAISTKFRHRIFNIKKLESIKAQKVIVAPAERHILSDIYALAISSKCCILPDTLQACSLVSLKKIIDKKIEKLIYVDAIYELRRYEQYLTKEFNLNQSLSIFQFSRNSNHVKKEYIVVFPAAGGSKSKQWPLDRFAYVLNNICKDNKYDVMICGTKNEYKIGEELLNMLTVRAKNICGKTDLSSLKELLSKSRLVLANDSGSAHFSIACGIPTIVICGCWEYGRFYPNSRMPKNSIAAIAKKDRMNCIPCGLSKPNCVGNGAVPCVLNIKKEYVLKKGKLIIKYMI